MAGQNAILQDECAGYEHVKNADRVLVGFQKRCLVGHGRRVEDSQIGNLPGADQSAVDPAESAGGQGGHLSYRFFKSDHVSL